MIKVRNEYECIMYKHYSACVVIHNAYVCLLVKSSLQSKDVDVTLLQVYCTCVMSPVAFCARSMDVLSLMQAL